MRMRIFMHEYTDMSHSYSFSPILSLPFCKGEMSLSKDTATAHDVGYSEFQFNLVVLKQKTTHHGTMLSRTF